MTYEEAVEISLEALKKQIPKKPNIQLGDNICPNCDCFVEMEWEKYCHHCGQAIDWSD